MKQKESLTCCVVIKVERFRLHFCPDDDNAENRNYLSLQTLLNHSD